MIDLSDPKSRPIHTEWEVRRRIRYRDYDVWVSIGGPWTNEEAASEFMDAELCQDDRDLELIEITHTVVRKLCIDR